MRVAERRIAEQTGRGIVCFISSFSYLSDISFVVMRQRLLAEFDRIWIDSLKGDSRETGKRTPEGDPDPSIFSTKMNPAGIRLGTCIGLFARKAKREKHPAIKYREFWGAEKRERLDQSLNVAKFEQQYGPANPEPFNRYSFRPTKVGGDFRSWPTLPQLGAIPPVNGLMEKRGGALIDMERSKLETRMQAYFDSSVSWDAFKMTSNPLRSEAARYDPDKTRKRLIHDEGFQREQIVRYFLRPFEFQYCYYSGVRLLWNEPRPQLWNLTKIAGNRFLISRPAGVASPEGVPFYFLDKLGDNDAIRGHAYYFPSDITRMKELFSVKQKR
jgi:hypothetical protein